MNVFVIGAAGKVGSRLARLLTESGVQVTGMHRNLLQFEDVAATGATPLIGDLITDQVAKLASWMTGHDAVVFTAGAHGTGIDQTSLIDGRGLEKAAAAAQSAGVPRFVLVSALPEAGRDAERGERFEHYLKVKKATEVHLIGTDLDWLILRPGSLHDEPGSGLVAAGPAVLDAATSRDNVAAFIAAVLAEPLLSREIIELTDGEASVADAVAGLTPGGRDGEAGRRLLIA
ncbi:NAD(P)-binding oxidoreductase [Propionicimonas sp.]|uniref:NAD(P)-binding oxidoreductase n=1 Tax=Propionicimonas sp. TaxID=1955623 RepID=UPI0017B264C5|nr:NAD(P)-binding oxidoreductase [Propionicimonas sp.]MBU3977867.1 SDR family oxidoreductase [Actinomycetota bacterium]MBA3021910.1 SDR family oxidoreductase [Propionicimonas sp.]MBU3987644.1 SDR family oxidoreductase [Actinomycetota bacterium]MBU4007366.1 SDR family oxidoreductase [Actinomycetota bacterium]MBU4065688.1 SDR family oxidoreductase [Actinomycetota bacterium]